MKNNSLSDRRAAFEKEFSFRTSRSSGKGGQHVNKVSTRVELCFDVLNSQVLSKTEIDLVMQKLANDISQEGILQIASQSTRSQLRNKEDATKKFFQKIKKALRVEKPRKKMKKPKALDQKRLRAKRIQSEKKLARQKVNLLSD
ncbi:MAG: alternative ribosome rescue aminoacyl-tRNA hydrolase ArfB [Bacteroidota bacterium]